MQIFCIAPLRYNGMTLFRYYEGLEIFFWGKMGCLGNMGLISSEISKFISELFTPFSGVFFSRLETPLNYR